MIKVPVGACSFLDLKWRLVGLRDCGPTHHWIAGQRLEVPIPVERRVKHRDHGNLRNHHAFLSHKEVDSFNSSSPGGGNDDLVV